MSYSAFRVAHDTDGLSPTARLLLYELAGYHNAETGACYPSSTLISKRTGLAPQQIKRAFNELRQAGIVEPVEPRGLRFPSISAPQPVPPNYWPAQSAFAEILAAFPTHQFDENEAVNDFITFCTTNQRHYAPGDLDRAFIRNISAILSTRPPGRVSFASKAGRSEPSSVGSLLAGRR